MSLSVALCRLLRNRVSAQQARERKKSYVSNLEAQAKQSEQLVRTDSLVSHGMASGGIITGLEQTLLDVQVAKLQQEVKTLERENVMLRQVIRNMQGGGGKAPEST